MRNKQSGFTIIEVVLVLAIASLIFLIVFLALPQLQKSRRDTQRKSDVAKVMGYLEKYASNSSGAYPPNLADPTFVNSYIATDPELKDPSTGVTYVTGFTTTEETNPDWTSGGKTAGKNGGTVPAGLMAYSRNAYCVGDHSEAADGNARVALMIKLESGQYCVDNS